MKLQRITIGTPRLDEVVATYLAITGVQSGQVTRSGDSVEIPMVGTSIVICKDDRKAGLVSISLQTPTPRAPASLSGIEVNFVSESNVPTATTCNAHLDHVALRVRDINDSAGQWTSLTGVEAHMMGIHPVSNGTFTAARLLLGERMIELVSPVPGVPSLMADRLESHGEGVAALALPVDDLAATTARLESLNRQLLDQPPHIMVHPRETGGVLVQLTPRVAH